MPDPHYDDLGTDVAPSWHCWACPWKGDHAGAVEHVEAEPAHKVTRTHHTWNGQGPTWEPVLAPGDDRLVIDAPMPTPPLRPGASSAAWGYGCGCGANTQGQFFYKRGCAEHSYLVAPDAK